MLLWDWSPVSTSGCLLGARGALVLGRALLQRWKSTQARSGCTFPQLSPAGGVLLQVSVNQEMSVDFPELEELGPEGPLDGTAWNSSQSSPYRQEN